MTCKQLQFVTKKQHMYIWTVIQWTHNNYKYAYNTSEHTQLTMSLCKIMTYSKILLDNKKLKFVTKNIN